jgi:hypothetical protein
MPGMFAMPDYTTLRTDTPFHWHVGSSAYALLELTGTPLGEYNLRPEVCIEAYRAGRPLFREVFPDAEHIPMPSLYTPAISYGHVNGLGSELIFPDHGEVAHTHIYASLEEGIRALRRPVDFASAGMAPFYLDFKRRLEKAFPGETVGFSYGLEGPLTTAYELRGDGIFYDLMDRPGRTREFLHLATASINAFRKFLAAVRGVPAIDPRGAGLCDDIASMVPARLFPDLVLPFWHLYYEGHTTGSRSAHVEDLRAEQLPFLEQVGLSRYDPSISPKLNPRIIAANCRVPFGWRLGSFHYYTMSCRDVRDWVFQAVADGAAWVFTAIEGSLCRPEHVPKVNAFVEAAGEAEGVLKRGGSREDVGRLVSPAGRRKFWDRWPEGRT